MDSSTVWWIIIGIIVFFYICGRGKEKGNRNLQSTKLSATQAQKNRTELSESLSSLYEVELFRFDNEALQTAWEKRDTSTIEALLRHGDGQNRAAWQKAFTVVNTGSRYVDLARGNLARTIKNGERIVTAYGLNTQKIDLKQTPNIKGFASLIIPKRQMSINSARFGNAVGGVLARGATGNIPWQAALAVTVATAIGALVYNQRALRKLKEIEGQLRAQEADFAGDLDLFRNILATRITPQLDEILRLTQTIDSYISALPIRPNLEQRSASATELALKLAFAVKEASYFLQMTAGD